MADRRDFFFKQKVTEAEMDEAFNDMEVAERNIITDLSFTGVINNGVVTESTPTPDLNVLVTGPMIGRTPLGEHLAFASNLSVDMTVDGNLPEGTGGTGDGSTIVVTSGNERWGGLFLVFDRKLQDPRTDGLGTSIFYDRLESFHFVIVASAEFTAPIAIGNAPATPAGAIRLADVRLKFSQTQIFNADIDITNRDDVIFADASKISVTDNFPNLSTSVNTVQETLEAHIAQTEDPHGDDMTISSQLVVGRTGVPTGGLPFEVVGAASVSGDLATSGGDVIASSGEVRSLGFLPEDDVRNVALSAAQAPRISKGQTFGTVARVSAAGALVGAEDVNVASITDNGTGDHTVNFDRNHSSVNYIVQATLDDGTDGRIAVGTTAIGNVQILTFNGVGAAADREFHLTTIGVLV